ncbi:unnamed protein product [Orchesella dallaii]|uniref:Gustatory receptor n=1 Tax=Orchesella dallaii TaxID=48710 RepID=A0ABP1RP55_9HEXA
MSNPVPPEKILVKSIRVETPQIETQLSNLENEDEKPEHLGKLRIFHYYFLTGYYALIIPFRINRRHDGRGFTTDTWIVQKLLCLLILWPLSWVFYITELASLVQLWSTKTSYSAKDYINLAYSILHLAFQLKFHWVVMRRRVKLEKLFNDVSAFSLFQPQKPADPSASIYCTCKKRFLSIYMFYLTIFTIIFVILRKCNFGVSLRTQVPIGNQFSTAIETGRARFFLPNDGGSTTKVTNMDSKKDYYYTTEDIITNTYSTEDIIIGCVELILQFIKMWNESFVLLFFYGALPATFWSASKRFQSHVSDVCFSREGSTMWDQAYNAVQADLIVKKYEELRNLVASLNSFWSTAALFYVLEMTLTLIRRINLAFSSNNSLHYLFTGNSILFLIVSLVMLAEGHRINACFKQWLCERYVREQVFALRKTELEWLQRDLEVGSVGIGSIGAYEISYGFIAQVLMCTALLITF